MFINYNGEITFLGELDIDNIGQFALEASNDDGMFWYYVVRTTYGTVSIAHSGPRIPDVSLLPKSFTQKRYQMQFNEDKIIQDVTKFLNDRNKKITKVEIIEIDDAIEQFVNLKDYLENFSEDLY